MKRIRLHKVISGPGNKQFVSTVYETSAMVSGNSTTFVAGMSGNIINDTTITVDHTLYNVDLFERDYSIQNQELIESSTARLNTQSTDSAIIDTVQVGDYAFNLTNPTTLGTRYALENNEVLSGSNWYTEPHQVVTYVPGTSACEIDLIIDNINFNITPENPDLVFGEISGTGLILYTLGTSGISGNTVYSLSGGVPDNLPFNYLLEQPLIYNAKFAQEAVVFGDLSASVTYVYTPDVSGSTVYSPYPNADDTNKIYVNPFKLKNMYNYNFETEITRPDTLYGVRDYTKVGKTQESLWLRYKYYRENPTIVQDFDLVERVKGLYKYKPNEGHKSNIYSIRILNSGLNQNLTDETIKQNIRDIVEQTVHNVVKRIAPLNTQLWKIEWQGV